MSSSVPGVNTMEEMLAGKSLDELEKLQTEKRAFATKLESVVLSLPARIQKYDEELARLQREKQQSQLMLDKTQRGVDAVHALLEHCEQEIKRRHLAANSMVDLTADDLAELDSITSLFGASSTAFATSGIAPPPSTPLSFEGASVISSGTNRSVVTPLSNQLSHIQSSPPSNPSGPTQGATEWFVNQQEDARVTKLVQARWQIMKSIQPLKHVLEGYNSTRFPRDFTRTIPRLEERVGNHQCALCNRVIVSMRVRLPQACDKCSFHPACAAIHLDFMERGNHDASLCVASIFGKCDNHPVVASSPATAATSSTARKAPMTGRRRTAADESSLC